MKIGLYLLNGYVYQISDKIKKKKDPITQKEIKINANE